MTRQADGLTAQLASLRYNTTGSPLVGPVRNSRRTGGLALAVGVELIRGQNTKTLTANS